jgi:polysaccharide pyruvyl transferase WcaK-like protein
VRIVAIGDVGVVDDMIHLGDEAMFEECIVQLRARGVSHVTAVSANPADTGSRYAVEAVAGTGFGAPSPELRAAVRASDAVIITGGGNLSSLWPIHIAQRASIAALAREFDKPLVVTGQTLGPWLDSAGKERVGELLARASLVGVREAASFELARVLGVPADRLQLNPDDASFLGDDGTASETAGSYCLVTLASHVGDADRDAVSLALAALLDEVVAVTGLGIRFLAHHASLRPGPARGDAVMHERVAAAMAAPSATVPTTDARAAAVLARGASLIVSSRYHPIVFGVAAGVPSIGISVDDYTGVKLRGALTAFGQAGPLTVEALLAHKGAAAVRQAWGTRDEIRERGLTIATERRGATAAWWDRVAEAIRAQAPPAVP